MSAGREVVADHSSRLPTSKQIFDLAQDRVLPHVAGNKEDRVIRDKCGAVKLDQRARVVASIDSGEGAVT